MMGFPDRARARCRETLALAEKLDRPLSDVYAHWLLAIVFHAHRKSELALQHVARSVGIAEEQGFPQHVAWITGLRGCVGLNQGRVAAAIAALRDGMVADSTIGLRLFTPVWSADLGVALGCDGRVDEDIAAISARFDDVASTGETYAASGLHRVRSELLRLQNPSVHDEAVACLARAIEIAQTQKARLWELRISHPCCRTVARGIGRERCWRPSTTGSPWASILATCRTRDHCWMIWPEPDCSDFVDLCLCVCSGSSAAVFRPSTSAPSRRMAAILGDAARSPNDSRSLAFVRLNSPDATGVRRAH